LFVLEAPEVRFDDVFTVTCTEPETLIEIDPKFVEVCEVGSLQVCGCVPNLPVLVGATVLDNQVQIRLPSPATVAAEPEPVSVVVRLTGIRKGFKGHRFPDRDREQFIANEAFIRSAYPGRKKKGN
jgi:hypothetical protein